MRSSECRLVLLLKRILEQGDMVVGFETDWTSFIGSRGHVFLIKLCTQFGCLLIKLESNGSSNYHPLLKKFFANKDLVFAGVHIKKDVEKLEAYGYEIRNAVELSEMAAELYERPCLRAYGVKDLVTAVLSRHLHTIPYQVDFQSGAETTLTKEKMEHATAVTYAIYKTAKILLNL
ncbi:hypothetical protein Dsin_033169 [Dipteronia sinensis]|uniref:3'-5' exonuclease domain-containing protein n=1 Tax=Dipteronia sinensis TaxID=43782 RepID=A0AAD9Z9A9_9ROSI|nr:hypothetical protein Dsin_033169 [Dipteronia sinensis]